MASGLTFNPEQKPLPPRESSAPADDPKPKKVTDPAPATGVAGEPFVDTEEKLLHTAPYVASIATDISQLLAPYVNQLTRLGPEYQSELEYLKPYLNPQNETFSDIVNTSKSEESPSGNTAVNAADSSLSAAVEAMNPPGFGGASQLVKGYEQSIPYQSAEQAALAYQKYLQTYQGYAPATTGWSPQAQGAYQFITGNAPSSQGGAPGNPLEAAAGVNAAATLGLTPTSNTTGAGQVNP
jgi:hypothetical protein